MTQLSFYLWPPLLSAVEPAPKYVRGGFLDGAIGVNVLLVHRNSTLTVVWGSGDFTESSGLEKPLKLLQSNHEPHTDRSQLHQIPQCWVNPTLQPLQGWGLPPCPGQPILFTGSLPCSKCQATRQPVQVSEQTSKPWRCCFQQDMGHALLEHTTSLWQPEASHE